MSDHVTDAEPSDDRPSPFRILTDGKIFYAAVSKDDCARMSQIIGGVEQMLLTAMNMIRHEDLADATQAIQGARLILGRWSAEAGNLAGKMEQAARESG